MHVWSIFLQRAETWIEINSLLLWHAAGFRIACLIKEYNTRVSMIQLQTTHVLPVFSFLRLIFSECVEEVKPILLAYIGSKIYR